MDFLVDSDIEGHSRPYEEGANRIFPETFLLEMVPDPFVPHRIFLTDWATHIASLILFG